MVNRGQIWIVDFNPALVISIDLLNTNLPTIIVIPLSSQIKKLGPERVFLPKESTKLDKDSVILPHLIRAVDKKRLIEKIGRISQEKMLEIEESLKLVLGMIEI